MYGYAEHRVPKLLRINCRFGSCLRVAKERREMESITCPHVAYKDKKDWQFPRGKITDIKIIFFCTKIKMPAGFHLEALGYAWWKQCL